MGHSMMSEKVLDDMESVIIAFNQSLERPFSHWTADDILNLSDAIVVQLDHFTPRQLDDIIGDLSLALAHEKAEGGNGKRWKHVTLDGETQALICKLAEIEINLEVVEEFRMNMTLAPLRRRPARREALQRQWRGLQRFYKDIGKCLTKWSDRVRILKTLL
ncbi:hypothetical protein ACLMJK_008519 [Lecanora helva]